MQEKIHQTALLLLTRRDHTTQELKQKLRFKGYQPNDIDAVIQRLNDAELINETRFVENYIAYNRKKGLGPERIRMELKKRGITDEVIAEQLDINDNAWLIEIKRIWLKHFKAKIPNDMKQRAKQVRFFKYRGFTQAQVNSILKDDENNE